MTKELKVIQDPDKEVPAEILAVSIKRIGDSMRILDNAGLSDRAILLLVSHAANENQSTTKRVLDGLRNLEKLYLKPRAR